MTAASAKYDHYGGKTAVPTGARCAKTLKAAKKKAIDKDEDAALGTG